MNSQEIFCNTPFFAKLRHSQYSKLPRLRLWPVVLKHPGRGPWCPSVRDMKFFGSAILPQKCAIHQVGPVWSVFQRGNEKQSWSFLLLNTWLAEWYPKVLPDATLSIACRRVGGAIINSSTPRRVPSRSNTSSSTKAAKICFQKTTKICRFLSCHRLVTKPIFQPTTGPLIVAAQRIIWDCSAEAWHEITRGWRGPFVKKGDLLTSHLRHF